MLDLVATKSVSLWLKRWEMRWDENETSLRFSFQCQSELAHLVVLVMCLVWCLVSRLGHVSSVFPCVFPSSFLFSSCYINIRFRRPDLLFWADITTSWTWWSFSLTLQILNPCRPLTADPSPWIWTCFSSTSHRCLIGLRFVECGHPVNT